MESNVTFVEMFLYDSRGAMKLKFLSNIKKYFTVRK